MAVDFKTQETELATLVNQSKTLYAEIEQKGDKATAEDRQKLTTLIEDGEKKRAALEELKKLAKLDDYANGEGGDGRKSSDRSDLENGRSGGITSPALRKAWGRAVINSQEFKQNDRRELMPVQVGGFKHLFGGPGGRGDSDMESKAIYAGTDASGGYATVADRQPDILDIARQRPRSVIDLVNKSATTVDAVEYVIMDTRTNSAAIVPEYTGGNFGLKPESNLTLDLKTATVNTIATWVAASRQILNDAPRLRALIDNELTYMVEVALEDKLVTDILAWSGIQSRVHAVSGRAFNAADTIADTLRRAITDLYLEFYRPDGIVLHPTQGEALELLKATTNQYVQIYDSVNMRVWRVPVVETPAITSGTALVGNFQMGVTVWDREQTQVLTGQPNDFFLRNAWAILAELREAHAVTRPKAVEKVTGL